MTTKTPITLARGDGIGPEIMQGTLEVLDAAGALLDIEEIEIGRKVYEEGYPGGIRGEAWESLRRTGIFLKAPITTPQGGGYKSLNVTIRKSMGLFANIRPCQSYAPFVKALHPHMDLVIVRENEEDLYGGIEYQHTGSVTQSLKLITRQGCERICRYAFEYARAQGRKKVTCMTKDNIMKISDGLFHKVFDEVGANYPEIEKNHMIIDIGAAKVAAAPHMFDVIVLPNLYGDIVSDIAAEVAGSVGMGGSANIGAHCAMFEAVHGSAPDIAGQDLANPSGLLSGAVMMLNHIGQSDAAEKIHNALLRTLEDGIHTGDLYKDGESREKVGTRGFTRAVIERLGQNPEHLTPVSYAAIQPVDMAGVTALDAPPEPQRELIGMDVFIHWPGTDAHALADMVKSSLLAGLELSVITNRGTMVWPQGQKETALSDQWRLRLTAPSEAPMEQEELFKHLSMLGAGGFEILKTENLYRLDGQNAFSAAQGQ